MVAVAHAGKRCTQDSAAHDEHMSLPGSAPRSPRKRLRCGRLRYSPPPSDSARKITSKLRTRPRT
eukprot:8707094-Alexandrium_andersonii.AAC.1